MIKMKDETAVSDWLAEINGFTNSGIYMGFDEVEYAQKKYNRCLELAPLAGGLEHLAGLMAAHIPTEKKIITEDDWTEGYTPLLKLFELYQTCTFEDLPRFDEDLPRYRMDGPEWDESELALFAKADAHHAFMSEFRMMVGLISVASEHC